MYPVPTLARQIESEWATELAEYFHRNINEITQKIRPWFDFPAGQLRIELMEGSEVQFSWAFHIVNEGKRAVAVFTEHCGHHVFPYHEAKVFRDGTLIYAQGS